VIKIISIGDFEFMLISFFSKTNQLKEQVQKLILKGIGLIDACLIYSRIETNSLLWKLDKKIINYLDKKYLYD
jgi:hypothetical protein